VGKGLRQRGKANGEAAGEMKKKSVYPKFLPKGAIPIHGAGNITAYVSRKEGRKINPKENNSVLKQKEDLSVSAAV